MEAMLAQQLVGAGEHVVDVARNCRARVRLMDTGRIDKSDPNDARSAAIVALRNATLNTFPSWFSFRMAALWFGWDAPLAKEPAGLYVHGRGRPLLGRMLAGKSQRELRELGIGRYGRCGQHDPVR